MRRGFLLAAAAALAVLAAPGARAQAPAPNAPAAPAAPVVNNTETFEIGLSTDRIGIDSAFTGTRLVIFGALDNVDSRILREQRYDIVVVLVGPRRPVVVREKESFFGLWLNRGSEAFNAAPMSYALASSRPLGDIAPGTVLERLGLGIDNLRLQIDPDGEEVDRTNRDRYAEALRRVNRSTGLYNQSSGTIEFVSSTLFRAELSLPADLPTGQHTARAFLFRQGALIREDSETLFVVKTGFESVLSTFALRQGYLYGVAAVLLAIVTGWFGRIIFKRD
ncbi:TIGR02186 family protein [Antarcticirhabdus aurantiaca]|uniref:TIGR02186 family protein n=1 Tax=Antarcticirhabdus aurantiaca TaxID=2606717 RepID=A0ACD4NJ52_9HYPH|nr:TIGR02186 family protein [Antarcticirhabdus aurantiaca]WAJ26794.1 TIGR02186 family protein [Jeongeuplla avenae]